MTSTETWNIFCPCLMTTSARNRYHNTNLQIGPISESGTMEPTVVPLCRHRQPTYGRPVVHYLRKTPVIIVLCCVEVQTLGPFSNCCNF